jgi:hypothetical protein
MVSSNYTYNFLMHAWMDCFLFGVPDPLIIHYMIHSRSGDKKKILGESLIVLGEIGGNDYNFWFMARKPREQAYQFIPDVVGCIGSYAQVHAWTSTLSLS